MHKSTINETNPVNFEELVSTTNLSSQTTRSKTKKNLLSFGVLSLLSLVIIFSIFSGVSYYKLSQSNKSHIEENKALTQLFSETTRTFHITLTFPYLNEKRYKGNFAVDFNVLNTQNSFKYSEPQLSIDKNGNHIYKLDIIANNESEASEQIKKHMDIFNSFSYFNIKSNIAKISETFPK